MRETDLALAAFFDHWVTAAPDSYEARMARAMYRWGQADLIAHPVAYQGINADRAWQDYRSLRARHFPERRVHPFQNLMNCRFLRTGVRGTMHA